MRAEKSITLLTCPGLDPVLGWWVLVPHLCHDEYCVYHGIPVWYKPSGRVTEERSSWILEEIVVFLGLWC